MILVRDQRSAERHEPPHWMDGAPDLQCREDANGRIWAIGDGRMVGPEPEAAWRDLGDGWQIRSIKPLAPSLLVRVPLWCGFARITDQQERVWLAPRILAADGVTLAIQVTYGPGWVPDLTPAQLSAVAAARWARQTLTAAVESGVGLDVAACCAATADILAATYYINADSFAVLRLFDDGFIQRVLRIAAGWPE